LFIPHKKDYVRGKKPKVNCLLCAIVKEDTKVEKLIVYKSCDFYITLNLYPYNPGHLMIFPTKHVEDIRELEDTHVLRLHNLTKISLDILDKLYKPCGFNLGYNLKEASGASVKHLHLHIVPRYKNELGFIDIISDARIMIEDPHKALLSLQKEYKKVLDTTS
jgi:ATP adenylyltransferase